MARRQPTNIPHQSKLSVQDVPDYSTPAGAASANEEMRRLRLANDKLEERLDKLAGNPDDGGKTTPRPPGGGGGGETPGGGKGGDNTTIQSPWALTLLHNESVIGRPKKAQAVNYVDSVKPEVKYFCFPIRFSLRDRECPEALETVADANQIDVAAKACIDAEMFRDELVKMDGTDPSAGYLGAKIKRSIVADNYRIMLKGDIDEPGNSYYYGTDSSGDKGWYAFPTGYSGYSGVSGYSGASGYSGQNGSAASSGYSGFSGYSGTKGDTGTTGASGYSGASGKSGFSGFSGAVGQSGYSGASGGVGSQGTSGYSGVSGYSGAVGATGTSGYSGTSGKSGYSGASGVSGYSGVGTSGYSGYSGLNGSAASSGYSGYSGKKGDTGAEGASGYSGRNGANGSSGYSGFSGGNGSDGASGYSGINGINGASGYSGANGTNGTSGYSGYSGLNGSAASSGYSGYSGAIGASGYSGYSGARGISGYSGSTGPQGTSGYSGTSGFSGYSGQNGSAASSGTSGWSGYSGSSGYSGTNGATGNSGYSGYSGAKGDAGSSGYSGYSGRNGTNGSSGYSGYSGNNGSNGTSGYSGYSGRDGSDGAAGTSGYSGYSGAAAVASAADWLEDYRVTDATYTRVESTPLVLTNSSFSTTGDGFNIHFILGYQDNGARTFGTLQTIGAPSSFSNDKTKGKYVSVTARDGSWFNIENAHGGTANNRSISTDKNADILRVRSALFYFGNWDDGVWHLISYEPMDFTTRYPISDAPDGNATHLFVFNDIKSLPTPGYYHFDVSALVAETTGGSPANTAIAQTLELNAGGVSYTLDKSPIFVSVEGPKLINTSLQGSVIAYCDVEAGTDDVTFDVVVTLPNGALKQVTSGYVHVRYLGATLR